MSIANLVSKYILSAEKVLKEIQRNDKLCITSKNIDNVIKC